MNGFSRLSWTDVCALRFLWCLEKEVIVAEQ